MIVLAAIHKFICRILSRDRPNALKLYKAARLCIDVSRLGVPPSSTSPRDSSANKGRTPNLQRNIKDQTMNIDPVPQRAPYQVSPPRYSVSHQMATTAFELPNFRVTQNLGVVRGIVVRSRNVFATLGAALQQVVGGNITIWTKRCEETRRAAFEIMIQQ